MRGRRTHFIRFKVRAAPLIYVIGMTQVLLLCALKHILIVLDTHLRECAGEHTLHYVLINTRICVNPK